MTNGEKQEQLQENSEQTARNMIYAVTYLIRVARQAKFFNAERKLGEARTELRTFACEVPLAAQEKDGHKISGGN